VPAEKIHLTLAFLGEVPAESADDLVKSADRVREGPFELVLDRVGAFRRARVAWAGCSAVPAALTTAEATLRGALQARGFELEARDFNPHVTLVRKAEKTLKAESIPLIAWRIGEIALVRSDMGKGTYTTMATWPLKAKKKK
jgi:2'-5' RNA ligase